MKQIFIALAFLTIQTALAQQKADLFSELSNKKVANAVTIEVSDGYVCCLREGKENKLYKIDKKGKIIGQKKLDFDNYLRYGSIVSNGNRVYFHGERYKPFDGVNVTAFYQSARKTVFEINADFSFGKENIYDVIPRGAGNVNENSSSYIYIRYQNSAYFDKDTLFVVRSYNLFDTLTSNFIGGSNGLQLEKTYLNSTYSSVKSINTNVYQYCNALTTNQSIFIYGETDGSPVGRFDRNGNLQAAYKFDDVGSGDLAAGSTGQHNSNKIYSTYVKNPLSVNTNCKGEGTVIDIRDEEFNVKKIINVPDCNVIPSGSRPFAFGADNSVYLQTLNSNGRYAKLFKYDDKLNVKWERKINGSLFPVQIIATADNGALFTCIEIDTITQDRLLRLYKIDADGVITSTTTIEQLSTQKQVFYPNPFQSQLTLQQGIEGATEVCLYDMSGRTVGTYTLENNSINVVDFLPVGTYIAQLKDAKGKILGVQTVVKE